MVLNLFVACLIYTENLLNKFYINFIVFIDELLLFGYELIKHFLYILFSCETIFQDIISHIKKAIFYFLCTITCVSKPGTKLIPLLFSIRTP